MAIKWGLKQSCSKDVRLHVCTISAVFHGHCHTTKCIKQHQISHRRINFSFLCHQTRAILKSQISSGLNESHKLCQSKLSKYFKVTSIRRIYNNINNCYGSNKTRAGDNAGYSLVCRSGGNLPPAHNELGDQLPAIPAGIVLLPKYEAYQHTYGPTRDGEDAVCLYAQAVSWRSNGDARCDQGRHHGRHAASVPPQVCKPTNKHMMQKTDMHQ